jgi:methylmalonyl-CoA mutase N-terminal domain/subunit
MDFGLSEELVCNKEILRFNAISVSGTHIMEYGADTVQSVALAISISEVNWPGRA